MNDSADRALPAALPLDVRRGLTAAADAAHPLRWGILGAGSIATQWVEALAACAGATVTAVAARDRSRAEQFAARFGIATAYGDYAEMVAASDVDIVYIGTITGLHKEHTLLALAAGKHVLCEKPLADNAIDARAMYAAAAEQKVMLQDAMWTRFFPAVEHARTLIEEGAIGQVVLAQSDFFDPIYAVQAAPLAFGAGAKPTAIAVAGRNVRGALVEYGPDRTAVLTFPSNRSELPGSHRDRRHQGTDYPAPPGALPDPDVGMDGRRGPDPVPVRDRQHAAAGAGVRVSAAGYGEHAAPASQPARLSVSGGSGPPLSGSRAARVPAVRAAGIAARHGPHDRHLLLAAGKR